MCSEWLGGLDGKKIDADDKTIDEVLNRKKYIVDFFQREYRWEKKHIVQLIEDLTTRFLTNYKKTHERQDVKGYERYYLGPIVLCEKKAGRSIIDGQQRLTSITLLLIYLNNLQKGRKNEVHLSDLIFSEKYAVKSFNLKVPDREKCMNALYEGKEYDASNEGLSVKNIVERYRDIEELIPDELRGDALPYFVEWLKENVVFVEIVTYSDENAYTIFETMNDRGLNLTPTEMLKGYILSNLKDVEQKHELNEFWKDKMLDLKKISKEEDLDFFRAWLRARYADTIRPGRKGAANEDFEKIGTRFHSWVRDSKKRLGLKTSRAFHDFVMEDMRFYVNIYLKIQEATEEFMKDLESVFYIGFRGLASSIFYPLLMAPINLDDNKETITRKLAIMGRYLEIFIVFRSVNYRNYSHSSIRYTMYSLVKEVRGKDVTELSRILKKKASELDEDLDGVTDLGMHGQNKRFIHFLLARITSYIENRSGIHKDFWDYVRRDVDRPFQVEHIWSDNYDDHKDEFDQRDDFADYRNSVGALLLLPEGFNKSYGALSYKDKLPHYFGQNLLAKSLNPKCYERNPDFLRYMRASGLPFSPHEHFKKKDVDERQELYRRVLEEIYSLEALEAVAK